MKRMLINATQEEELRMAMVDGQRLYDLNIEGPASERKKANIYKGKITRIEPSLEAAFVDYGAERHGFLPLKEVSSEYFVKESSSGGKPNIREVLREGQDIVVQIDKEERGNKGAALTTFVSLAGRFIVLKPNKARSGGVSRRIVGGDRDSARKSLNDVEIPDGMSVILRTAGIDRSAEELGWDLDNLLKVWQAILNVVTQRPSPFLIYRESNAVVRALRDYLTNEIGEILIDDQATYDEAKLFVEQVMPHNLKKLKHYTDAVPLFTRFQIETQIESAFAHDVSLPSGGSIVVDHTEALVSIDINSARATKGGDIEATALNTNLEAAEEIARQLRLRDLGGLIVIDFIDMGPQKNQRAVENKLREAVRQDRARVQIGKISRFGLLEMSRQRLRPSLGESSYHTCPRCSGIGTIRSVESLALGILRIIGEEARKERTAKVIAQLPVEVATYLLNEKRDWVQSLESKNDTQVVLVANASLETPHFDIRRVRDDQTELPENTGASFQLVDAEPEAFVPPSMDERKIAEEAAVGTIAPSSPAPARKQPEPTVEPAAKKAGLLTKIMSFFSSDDAEAEEKPRRKTATKDDGRPRKKKKAAKKDGDRPRKKTRGKKKAEQQADGAQEDRKPRRKRKRKSRKAKSAGDLQQNQQQNDQDGNEQAESKPKRPARNRRSRGGRRRRQDAEQQDAKANDSGKEQQDTAPPKARTDAERAADREQQVKQAQPDKAEKADKADGGNGSMPSQEAAPRRESDKQAKSDSAGSETSAKSNGKDGGTQDERPKDRPEQKSDGKRATDDGKAGDSAAREDRRAAPEDAPKKDKPKKQEAAEQQPDSGKPSKEGRLLPWEPVTEAPGDSTKPPAKSSDSRPDANAE